MDLLKPDVEKMEAEKDVKRLSKGNRRIAIKILSAIKDIASGKELMDVKKLSGDNKERLRLKIQDYRIIFKIKEDIMIIYVIKSRQEVYKWLKNN